MKIKEKIIDLLSQRILLLDGATGTMLQGLQLTEANFRGELLKHHPIAIKGNYDILCLTAPKLITTIHEKYLAAGADIIKTNTFNATSISQSDYQTEDFTYDINYQAALLAKQATLTYASKDKPRFVAGSIGPTNKTLSISPKVEDPAYRAVTFEEVVHAYMTQIEGLMDGSADLLLIETIFDTHNARACLMACDLVFAKKGYSLPIMLSVTITDKSGRTLSGQTLEAFVASMKSPHILSVGLNCSFGAKDLLPYAKELSTLSDTFISIHPNAGLPNQLGQYDELPGETASLLKELTSEGYINIVGGCCGTTDAHIKAIYEAVKDDPPHISTTKKEVTTLYAGLEVLSLDEYKGFINIGERTNVSGSRKFARLIREKKYEEALDIARKQVEDGALIIDINFDDGLLDGKQEMQTFLRLIASEPEISKVPIMIDSSRWDIIEEGLQAIQGKPIVNSISLKNGEAEFLRHARIIQSFGASVVIMAFDEKGQADTYERKISIAKRAYDLLIKELNFPPEDIIFDVNILAVATGIFEHNNYAIDFIRAVQWIKENLPYAKTSGGLSNLSFSFRGNNIVREAMHSAFLFHAIKAGLDMAILNPALIQIYDSIEPKLLELVENVIFNKKNTATDELIELATKIMEEEQIKKEGGVFTVSIEVDRFTLSVEERLKNALVKGIGTYIHEDIQEALDVYPQALDIIEGPLMEGMSEVGELFGDGKMFLPQVVKSARVMKKSVNILLPHIEKSSLSNRSSAGKAVIATVKGDVHDIGKNIVSIVLQCNNFEIIDLGIMVEPDIILDTAEREQADLVLLSGLITPSLDEMTTVATMMEKRGMHIPLMVGGATTSKLHTALKIAPHYKEPVVHSTDATKAVEAAKALVSKNKANYVQHVYEEYHRITTISKEHIQPLVSLEKARELGSISTLSSCKSVFFPNLLGTKDIRYSVEELLPYIDWTFFFTAWGMRKSYPAILDDPQKGEEARKLLNDGMEILKEITPLANKGIQGVISIAPAFSENDTLYVLPISTHKDSIFSFPMLRQQVEGSKHLSCSDFILSRKEQVATKSTDYIGGFMVTSGNTSKEILELYKDDEYNTLMAKVLLDRLAEAFAEKLHEDVRKTFWGYAKDEDLSMADILKAKYQGIRPAFGYPSLPDHSLKEELFRWLDPKKKTGISLTKSYMMYPASSICGLIFSKEHAKYFDIMHLGKDQVKDYALQSTKTTDEIMKLLSSRIKY